MRPSETRKLQLNGISYQLRYWGDEGAPRLFLLHGWADLSASFQFVVDALQGDWRVIAPDWRGFGDSGQAPGGYWFADYLRDLDQLLAIESADEPARLVGHSMGGNIASLYAGIRPERVAAVVTLEGFGIPPHGPELAPARLREWLQQSRTTQRFRHFADFGELAERICRNSPRITRERAEWLAQHWGRAEGDRVVLRIDPLHRRTNPVLYREQEAMACWREIQAPVLWVEGEESGFQDSYAKAGADLADRRACFQNLQRAVVTEAGHMMHHEQPEQVAGLVEEFLQQHVPIGVPVPRRVDGTTDTYRNSSNMAD